MENPYQAPQAPVELPSASSFQELGWKELKKLRNHSHSIRTLGGLWTLGIIMMVVLFFTIALKEEGPLLIMLPLMLLVNVGAIYAAFARPSGGNVIGIVACAFMLIGFPLGTILGLLGILAFVGGKPLFGADKIRHKDLEVEYKHRKKNKLFDEDESGIFQGDTATGIETIPLDLNPRESPGA